MAKALRCLGRLVCMSGVDVKRKDCATTAVQMNKRSHSDSLISSERVLTSIIAIWYHASRCLSQS